MPDKKKAARHITPRRSCILLPRCSVCGQVPPGGIRDGIRLKKALICAGCEGQIVKCEVDSLRYQLLINKLKKIFL